MKLALGFTGIWRKLVLFCFCPMRVSAEAESTSEETP